jgi:hypothetical protein
MDLKCLDDYRLEITIDTHDNLKDLCLHCDVVDWRTDENICSIRADNFQQLENKLKARFEN